MRVIGCSMVGGSDMVFDLENRVIENAVILPANRFWRSLAKLLWIRFQARKTIRRWKSA